jgi:hypothetical protein
MICVASLSDSRNSPSLVESDTVGVGQDEHPSSEVRGSAASRGEHIPLRIVPEAGQRPEYEVKSPVNEAWDVLQENVLGSHLANDARDLGPEPSAVFGPLSLAGGAPRLAREARRDDMNDSAPRLAVKGGKVIPDRRFIQDAFFHARDKYRCRMTFPLNVTHTSVGISEGKSEAEFDAPDAST